MSKSEKVGVSQKLTSFYRQLRQVFIKPACQFTPDAVFSSLPFLSSVNVLSVTSSGTGPFKIIEEIILPLGFPIHYHTWHGLNISLILKL